MIERVALAAQVQVVALEHAGSIGGGDLGGGIGTVIGDDDDLGIESPGEAQAGQADGQAEFLVVGGDDDGETDERCGEDGRCCHYQRR